MGERIRIEVKNKIAKKTCDTIYVCGNSDYIAVFAFDGEWADHEYKTARFAYNGGHLDQVFSGNECPVPIITDTFSFRVGVFAGNLETTTAAYVPAKKSILCGSGAPIDPPDDVYNQIMQILHTGASDEQIQAAVNKYLDENPIDTGVQFETDETLKLENGILSVVTADKVEEDNTLPVTSAAVYTEVGNINALLATI